VIDLRAHIREIPDFPEPGILFRDLLPLVADPVLHAEVVRRLVEFAVPLQPDVIVGAEARGFLFGPTLAHELGCGFAPARKPGKLPSSAWRQSYALEYGESALELAHYAIKPGMRVLDTHLGSGSIAIAAHYAGVHLTACEIDAEYFAAATARIERETRQTELFIHHNERI
jgi:adenine phosphoribosyltransferase